jgi:CDP-diacylglycerol--glycerol-3-phosphate 3-phosphatidyltransferase
MQERHAMANSLVRQIPNLISFSRIISVPVLIGLALQERAEPFKWLLLAALLSDILDGLIARTFSLASTLGATLDSIGDSLLMIAAAVGVWIFHPDFIREYGLTVVLVLGLWLLEMVVSFWRYGRLSSFHAYSVRVGAYLLGIFVMVLFIWGFNTWLFYATVVVNVFGYLEEFVLLWLLPEWSPNARGVYWVLRSRREIS